MPSKYNLFKNIIKTISPSAYIFPKKMIEFSYMQYNIFDLFGNFDSLDAIARPI